MAGAVVHDAGRYAFSRADEVLVDTNVLLFVFSSTFGFQRPAQQDVYSDAFKTAQVRDAKLWTHPLCLSEMVNILVSRYQGDSPNAAHRARGARKDYMKSDQFAKDFKRVETTFHSVIESIEPLPGNRSDVSSAAIVERMSNYRVEWTDAAASLVCEEYGLILLSDDHDFTPFDLDLVTGNPRTLRGQA